MSSPTELMQFEENGLMRGGGELFANLSSAGLDVLVIFCSEAHCGRFPHWDQIDAQDSTNLSTQLSAIFYFILHESVCREGAEMILFKL